LAASSACPRATVIGVRSSWDALRTNVRSISRSDRSRSASRWTWLTAARWRLACHTMATNIAAMSGTSAISSAFSWNSIVSRKMTAPVTAMMTARSTAVVRTDHTLRP